MLSGTNNILQTNPHIQTECGEYYVVCRVLSIPHNIVMDLNNVMVVDLVINYKPSYLQTIWVKVMLNHV